MIKPRQYFPWKVGKRFFFSHFFFVVTILLLAGLSLRYFVYTHFLQAADIHQTLALFDRQLISLFVTLSAGSALYLGLSARHFARPLGRLIQRARELRRLEAPAEEITISEDEYAEEPGEWFDLERALNRVHRDLRTKTEALAREREELSTLIGAFSNAILAVDRQENPLFFNSPFALLFGLPAGHGHSTPSLSEIFRIPEIVLGYRSVMDSGKMRIINASIESHRDLLRHYSVSIAPLRSRESQGVYGAVGIFHDVTELKQSEQIRIEFVGNASHELRTPLTSIKGYVETLRLDLKAGQFDEAAKFLDVISRNVDRLIFLVNDLLDLSIIESGAELNRTVVSTREVSENVLKQVESRFKAKRQSIRVHYQLDSFLADARRVEQVLLNLVHNAIKYIPDGKNVDIIWDEVKGHARLRVKDDGPGVALEHQPRLFERFYRVDTGRAREQGGTGLGLAIVKHIMLKHGGSVRLESRPGHGAEFICDF